eukprot:7080295-Pyramimonas_sp.AAC.1
MDFYVSESEKGDVLFLLREFVKREVHVASEHKSRGTPLKGLEGTLADAERSFHANPKQQIESAVGSLNSAPGKGAGHRAGHLL